MADQGQGTHPPPTAPPATVIRESKVFQEPIRNSECTAAPQPMSQDSSATPHPSSPSSSETEYESIPVNNGHIRYDTGKSIGKRVFEAWCEVSGVVEIVEPPLAVKLRTVDMTLTKDKIEKEYWNEIKIGVKLKDNSNVAKYLYYGEIIIKGEPTIFMVTQQCDKTSLKALLPKYKMHQKKIIFTHLMYGLEYIHDNEIAHRDLKPSNFLLSLNKKKFKIIDFGISKEFMTNDDNTITTSSGFSGTFGWVASEMCGNDRSKRFEDWKKADVFSSGLLAYYIFTEGKYPYEGDEFDRHESIKKKKDPSFEAIKHDLNNSDRHSLIDLLETMLSHEPNKRPRIDEILQHCFFWDANKNMSFIHDVHRCFEKPFDDNPKKKYIKKLRIEGTVKQRMAYEIHKEMNSTRGDRSDSSSSGGVDFDHGGVTSDKTSGEDLNSDSNGLQDAESLENTALYIGSGDYKTSTSNRTGGNRESRSGRDKTKELTMDEAEAKEMEEAEAKERIRRVISDDWINIVDGWMKKQIKLREQKHLERKKKTVEATIGNREPKEFRISDLTTFWPFRDDCDEQEVDDASNYPCFNINKKNQRPYENSLTDLVRYIRNTHEYLTKEGLPNDEPIPESNRESHVAGQLNETTGKSEYSLQDFIKSKDAGMWEFVAVNFPELLVYLCQIMKEALPGDLKKKYFEEKAPNRPLVP